METNQTILDGIDPEIQDRLVNRREAIKRGASVSSMVAAGLAMGSVPVALAALAKDVFAQAPSDILDALQFAYILEHLENEFYKAVLDIDGNGNATQRAAFAPVRAAVTALPTGAAILDALRQIQKHEQAHVDFLRGVINATQANAAPNITAADFDFTGGNGSGTGPFARATTEPQFLLAAAQAFEDTGVRAYKGQAGRFLIASNAAADVALEAALRIHSVEARHAAKIRNVRRDLNTGETVIRYSGTVRGGGAAAAGVSMIANPPAGVVAALGLIYAGEENVSHVVNNGSADVTINVSTGVTGLGVVGTGQALNDAISEAFDEPLTKAQVITIVQDFIRNDASRGLP